MAIDAGIDPTKITKEWIENVILSGISPRVDGVRIKEIALASGRAAFVIDIPQATSRAPHQAREKRVYYKRHEFQSVPMEDYEVRDVLRRSSKPDLSIWFVLSPTVYDDERGHLHVKLDANIGNRTDEPALYATVRFMLDPRLGLETVPYFDRIQAGHNATWNGTIFPLSLFERHINPTSHQPIYKEKPVYLFRSNLILDPHIDYILGFEVSYPGGTKARYGYINRAKFIEMWPWLPTEPTGMPDD